MASPTLKLSNREKLAYGLGDTAANFVFQTQISFLLFYYTDVLGISALVAGRILVFSRVIDALNDPIIGALSDRTRSRWGRYRPWILWTALPLAGALVLCFTTPQLSAQGKIAWAIVTYNLLMILYAANNIPYCALSGVMTDNSIERTSLASWRFLCAMAAVLVVNMLTLDLVEIFGAGDRATGFQRTMCLWGVLAVLFFAATFAFTRERVSPPNSVRPSLREDLADLFTNRPWIALFVLSVLVYIQLALRSGSLVYYFEYYVTAAPVFDRIMNYGLFNGVGIAAVMVGVLLARPLAERFGTRRTFRVCLLLSAGLMASFAFVPPKGLGLLFTLQVAMQVCFGPTIPLLWAMMADVADYGHWKTGRRSTALAFASIVFATKLGLGIGVWLNGEVLQSVGYMAQAEAQSPLAVRGIVYLISMLPAAALLLGGGVLLFYPIDERLEGRIQYDLRQHDKSRK
jgi:sugar (glycoside-pentoside-hexuronide) transporter